jgi:hypothetical protein
MKKLMVYLSSIVILLLIVISQFSNNKILEKNSLIQQVDFSKIMFSSGISTNTYENKNDVWKTYKDIEVNSNFKKYMFNLLNTNIIEIYDSNKLRKEKFMGNELFSITLYNGSKTIEQIKVGKIDFKLDRSYAISSKFPGKIIAVNKNLFYDFNNIWIDREFINIPDSKIKEVRVFNNVTNNLTSKRVLNSFTDLFSEKHCDLYNKNKANKTLNGFVIFKNDSSMLSFQINHYEYKQENFACLIIKKTTDTANKYVKRNKIMEEYRIPYAVWTNLYNGN